MGARDRGLTVNDVERRWLDYAWGVVACPPAHAAECSLSGGTGVANDSGVRFPGFIGTQYEPHRGVLCMGHIHRHLPDRDDVEGGRLYDINASLSGWRTRGRSDHSDELFLVESRAAYLASAPTWDYWNRNYAPLLNDARVPLAEVAFANVAKCRTTTEDDNAASVRLAKICSRVFPPEALISLLQPAAVLLASLRLDVGVGDATIVRWNGRTGVDEAGSTMKNWLPYEAGRLRRLRTSA